MSPTLFFDNKKYLSAKDAGKLTGYTTDYIGQLCRSGKLDCKRIGRVWYVSEKSILEYGNVIENENVFSPTLPPKQVSESISEPIVPEENTSNISQKTVSRIAEISRKEVVFEQFESGRQVIFSSDFLLSSVSKKAIPFAAGLLCLISLVTLKGEVDQTFQSVATLGGSPALVSLENNQLGERLASEPISNTPTGRLILWLIFIPDLWPRCI